ncbi:MAG: carbamoyl-phosphate synthase (glutamine-hydrolyzing) small subunit [Nanoarchaeota archaeon]|nr:MAG: carbamoyl-phosphate synthase (glutamine-hydrolyzing) small subunit [Nanoarchaeota archaeon]
MEAKLVLEDGTMLKGGLFGAPISTAGEVVFNTGMVGYPESMTDPSYEGQILVCTYPLIGNYGIPSGENYFGMPKNFESNRIHVSGLIVADYSDSYSHWAAKKSLAKWMRENGIPGITGIDTRFLTKKLRANGVILGKIIVGKEIPFEDPNKKNLVKEVSPKNPVVYKSGKKKVVLVDCGAKNNIVRSLLERKITVIRVPWDHPFQDIKCDGLMISNGPGDPKMCIQTINSIKEVMKKEIPIFGICLGNQLLSLAAGADTYKLKFGHRGQNQPAIDVKTKRCYITSQNHGFAVNPKKLPSAWEQWFVNANDKTNEGIRHKRKPFYSVQFHPEATPGPTDTNWLFDKFEGDL